MRAELVSVTTKPTLAHTPNESSISIGEMCRFCATTSALTRAINDQEPLATLPKIGKAFESGPATRRVRGRCGKFDKSCPGGHPRWTRSPDAPTRPMADPTDGHGGDSYLIHHLLDMGRVSESLLLRRCQLRSRSHQSVLFTLHRRRVRSGSEGRIRPQLVPSLAGAVDPDLPVGFPFHVLLLPTQLLPSVLVFTTGLCRRRRPRQVQR